MLTGIPGNDPSRWSARIPVAGLALIGFAIAAYLAAYQIGLLAAPWDPLFGAASAERVLHSALARALPLPDAALGAVGYAVEIAADLAGGRRRWLTHPWLVLVFGCIALGMALVGLALIVVQIAVVHAAGTLCLASAVISVGVAGTVAIEGEVQAALRVVRARWARGRARSS